MAEGRGAPSQPGAPGSAPPARARASIPRGSAARPPGALPLCLPAPPRQTAAGGKLGSPGAVAGATQPRRPLPGVRCLVQGIKWMFRKCVLQAAGGGSRTGLQSGSLPAPSRQPLGGAGGRGSAWPSLWPGARAGPLGTGAGGGADGKKGGDRG